AGGAELADILDSPSVASIIDRYENSNRSAVSRQRSFQRLCGLTLTVIALLTYLSLVALALPLNDDMQATARFWALGVIYIGLLVAFSSMAWLHFSRPEAAWRHARA